MFGKWRRHMVQKHGPIQTVTQSTLTMEKIMETIHEHIGSNAPHNWQAEDIPKNWVIFYTSVSWEDDGYGNIYRLTGLDGRNVIHEFYWT